VYVHRDAKAVFLCHPRTASRATARLLETFGFVASNRAVPPFKTTGPSGHHLRIAERPEGWKVACTIRHHFDVIVSWLLNTSLRKSIQKQKGLDTLLAQLDMAKHLERDIHGTRRTYYPKQNEMLPNVEFATFIISYNHLEADLKAWLVECLGEAPETLDLQVIGNVPRSGMPCDQILDDAKKAAIIERYEVEMREWGFLVDGKAVGYQ